MGFLYEDFEALRKYGAIKHVPNCITENLSPRLEARAYQTAAFENFVTYFEGDECQKPTQVLFHMATGSGKTMIMAGLILYLYQKGYRNFLFFVNLSNIVQKTKENFLNASSAKYLFADEIIIDSQRVAIKEVTNFQFSDPDAINICFDTTQGLHMDMNLPREGSITYDDFINQRVVLISDEAHHLNVDTRKMNQDEARSYHSWESTVTRIFNANSHNILLEFTATCDVRNPLIRAAYERKIIFDYDLRKFREDGYSKEIKTLRSDFSRIDKALQAIVLSQYRLKVFQDWRQAVKPVVLFKAKTISESKEFQEEFTETIRTLSGNELERLSVNANADVMRVAWTYFATKGISFDQLAQELKDDFGPVHCISANDDSEANARQIALNSLEDLKNPYRAVFEVKKLDEGWDVLNLFDIVRLYETRDAKNNKPGSYTIAEAQLIGRGARYCPFVIEDGQERYRRKYDLDLDNPLRVCEELYYHCQDSGRYIDELHKALVETGIEDDSSVECFYELKAGFRSDPLYKNGYVFLNERIKKSRKEVHALLPSLKRPYSVALETGQGGVDVIMKDDAPVDTRGTTFIYSKTIAEIASLNYAIVQRALCRFPVFKFNVLKEYYPNLKSTRELIFSDDYLGDIRIDLRSKFETPSNDLLFQACLKVLEIISGSILAIQETYEGSREFKAQRLIEKIRDKRCHYSRSVDGGLGKSQNDSTVESDWRLDLSQEDWFVFNDNFGTDQEKAFVANFRQQLNALREKYDKIFLVRNERQVAIYSFEGGECFEPDYLLFLHSPLPGGGYNQLQIFIEPKGAHLISQDAWKEDFLLQLADEAEVIQIADGNDYRVLGFPFFNTQERVDEIKEAFLSIEQ